MTTLPGRTGEARVYFGPEPKDGGPHPGVRGLIVADAIGVHLDAEVEWVYPDNGDAVWESHAAHGFEGMTTVPWHRIDSIEWKTAEP